MAFWEDDELLVDPNAAQKEADKAAQQANIAGDWQKGISSRAQAAKLWNDKTTLAGKQLGDWTSQRGQGQQAMQAGSEQGLLDINRQGAEARANAAAAGGGNTASVYGGLLAAGKQIGNDQATYRAKAATDLAGYNTDTLAGTQERQSNVQDTGLQALSAQAEMGTETENSQKRWADVLAGLEKGDQEMRDSSTYVGEQDDRADQIQAAASAEPDPYVQNKMYEHAQKVRSGAIDV